MSNCFENQNYFPPGLYYIRYESGALSVNNSSGWFVSDTNHRYHLIYSTDTGGDTFAFPISHDEYGNPAAYSGKLEAQSAYIGNMDYGYPEDELVKEPEIQIYHTGGSIYIEFINPNGTNFASMDNPKFSIVECGGTARDCATGYGPSKKLDGTWYCGSTTTPAPACAVTIDATAGSFNEAFQGQSSVPNMLPPGLYRVKYQGGAYKVTTGGVDSWFVNTGDVLSGQITVKYNIPAGYAGSGILTLPALTQGYATQVLAEEAYRAAYPMGGIMIYHGGPITDETTGQIVVSYSNVNVSGSIQTINGAPSPSFSLDPCVSPPVTCSQGLTPVISPDGSWHCAGNTLPCVAAPDIIDRYESKGLFRSGVIQYWDVPAGIYAIDYIGGAIYCPGLPDGPDAGWYVNNEDVNNEGVATYSLVRNTSSGFAMTPLIYSPAGPFNTPALAEADYKTKKDSATHCMGSFFHAGGSLYLDYKVSQRLIDAKVKNLLTDGSVTYTAPAFSLFGCPSSPGDPPDTCAGGEAAFYDWDLGSWVCETTTTTLAPGFGTSCCGSCRPDLNDGSCLVIYARDVIAACGVDGAVCGSPVVDDANCLCAYDIHGWDINTPYYMYAPYMACFVGMGWDGAGTIKCCTTHEDGSTNCCTTASVENLGKFCEFGETNCDLYKIIVLSRICY